MHAMYLMHEYEYAMPRRFLTKRQPTNKQKKYSVVNALATAVNVKHPIPFTQLQSISNVVQFHSILFVEGN